MSQSKSSLLTAWLSLAFCHSAWKLTPTDFLMAVYSGGSFTWKIRQSAVCHTTLSERSIRVMLSWPLSAYWYTSKMPSKPSSMCWLMKATRGLERRMGITCFHSLHVLLGHTLLWGKDRVARGDTYPSGKKKILLTLLVNSLLVVRFFPPDFKLLEGKKIKIKKSIELRLNLTWKSTLLSERVYFVLLVIMGNDMSLPLADFASLLPCQ